MEIKNILCLIWEFPQTALGYIILKITKAETYRLGWCGCDVYSWKLGGGLSLGKYIFIPFKPKEFNNGILQYIKHEHGHSLQSKYLGWFYLLIIGLPSLIWCKCFGEYRRKRGVSYYAFYTEKWADRLGEVERRII